MVITSSFNILQHSQFVITTMITCTTSYLFSERELRNWERRRGKCSGGCKLIVLISYEIVFTSYLYTRLYTLLVDQVINQKLTKFA